MVADVAQHVRVAGHRDAAVDIDGAGAVIVGAVNDEADLGLHGAAGEQPNGALGALAVDAEGVQQLRDRQFLAGPVDHDAERAILVVLHHQDDRVLKSRVAHLGRGDQKLAG